MQEAAMAVKAAQEAAKVADTTVKKFWSVLDAASEKPSPSKVLDPKAIQAIQGARPQP